ncbi:MAG: ABC transporter ATP-binding protein [Desulfobacteraceae bacterium]|nr:MAG: ABC transporter ATP-binding protein [Desulfobacteraceae bacterium]
MVTASGAQNFLLSTRNLKTHFYTFEGIVRAVDGVSFSISSGQTYGLVGESGCGKSITALSILGLIPLPQGRIVDGEILFEGRNLLALSRQEMRRIRGNRIAMIFQEPMTSLNPVFTIGRQISEALRLHRAMNTKEAWQETVSLLDRVGIPSPQRRAGDFPHRLSGGMRQRAMIAMAMACRPELLIADEPTTALDMTIQAQILDLIQQLKVDFNMAMLLITHNFGVIAETAERTGVMYAGRIVEEAETRRLFSAPVHPYTQGLLRSLPRIGEKVHNGRKKLNEIPGIVPRLTENRRGCAFAPRCSASKPECRRSEPEFTEIGDGHRVRCFNGSA